MVKNLSAKAGDAREADSIPGSARSPGEGNGYPLQYSCLENATDRGGWWATVHGVAKSQTRLKRHSRGASQVALVVKNLPANAGDERDAGFDPWVRKTP